MALIEILARFNCDGCGHAFTVEIDPSLDELPRGWSVYDIAEDAVRGSVGYDGPKDTSGFGGISSVEDGKQLCGNCTDNAARAEAKER